jgi:2-methylcitrate dehydratase
MSTNNDSAITLPHDSNQALGLGQFACDFMSGTIGKPDRAVVERTELFFLDAVLCGLSALALGTNAPTILRTEALEYADPGGPTVLGSSKRVAAEKAICANAAAVREWDSNGTNFGYNPSLGHTAGEFGHNDFYSVPVAAAQQRGLDGAAAVRGMILLDEIRGRLAEVFSLKSYKIDHVVHGAIASAATYGAMMGATPEQIESAIGMVVAHYIPFRAIRAGKQLSDSKGASAAISTEVAILSMRRAMRGFIGPRDIFRNPEAIFRFFEPTTEGKDRWKEVGPSPFDLVLSHSGSDFAVLGMHFKMGLYEHQSAGALQGLLTLLEENPRIVEKAEQIQSIRIIAYEPAFGIIGNPAKKDPKTRQSADHSMAYIVATTLRKAIEYEKAHGAFLAPAPSQGEGREGGGVQGGDSRSTHPLPPSLKGRGSRSSDALWKALMLGPLDYSHDAIFNRHTRALMERITFEHGGKEYDEKYPDGIPTSIIITMNDRSKFDSGLVMYPAGHARNSRADLRDILDAKFEMLARLASEAPSEIIARFSNASAKSAGEMSEINNVAITNRGRFE